MERLKIIYTEKTNTQRKPVNDASN